MWYTCGIFVVHVFIPEWNADELICCYIKEKAVLSTAIFCLTGACGQHSLSLLYMGIRMICGIRVVYLLIFITFLTNLSKNIDTTYVVWYTYIRKEMKEWNFL